MSVMKLPSGRWRAQVYDPALGHNVSVSRILGGPGTFATKTEAKRSRERARERLGAVRARDVTVRDFWSAGRPIHCSRDRRNRAISAAAS